jgi:SAM-dependent methyltransferase
VPAPGYISVAMGRHDVPPPTDAELRGEELYGDNLSRAQVEYWFAENARGYSEVSGDSLRPEHYGYYELNRRSLLRHLPAGRRFRHALGLGSGYGAEFRPLADRIDRLTIVESGDGYGVDPALRMPTEVLRAEPRGDLPVEHGAVDLVTCFGVLALIPNVSHVISEFARVLEPGGFLLLREPATSLGGGWGRPSPGRLQGIPHARGIPRSFLLRKLPAHGFSVERESLHGFPVILKTWQHGLVPHNSPILTSLDLAICRVLAPRLRYHAENSWQKVRPTGIAILARRT